MNKHTLLSLLLAAAAIATPGCGKKATAGQKNTSTNSVATATPLQQSDDKYRVTLYSGGRPIREWAVTKYDTSGVGYRFKDNRTGENYEVSGDIVVEPYKRIQFAPAPGAPRPVYQGLNPQRPVGPNVPVQIGPNWNVTGGGAPAPSAPTTPAASSAPAVKK